VGARQLLPLNILSLPCTSVHIAVQTFTAFQWQLE
jgi:hypothetical protein